jgi:hypothetical protein
MTGYLHPQYAQSLAEFGTPIELANCGGWGLERQIQGFSHKDAMGCYPLFACRDWSQLHIDLDEICKDLVSFTVVTDPFGNYDLPYLQKCFHMVAPYKDHFVIDLDLPLNKIVSKSHRKTVNRAVKKVDVEFCPYPELFLEEWIDLFEHLISRHNISGIRAFSREAFAVQQFQAWSCSGQ